MRRRLLALVAVLTVAGTSVAQQVTRVFPMTALRGDIRFGEAPEIALNGRPMRLAPGTRIRDARNVIVPPATLMGPRHVVNYTIDELGNVRDVWLLSPEEARRPWPRTPQEAERLVFDPVSQSWSRP